MSVAIVKLASFLKGTTAADASEAGAVATLGDTAFDGANAPPEGRPLLNAHMVRVSFQSPFGSKSKALPMTKAMASLKTIDWGVEIEEDTSC